MSVDFSRLIDHLNASSASRFPHFEIQTRMKLTQLLFSGVIYLFQYARARPAYRKDRCMVNSAAVNPLKPYTPYINF